MKVRKVQTKTFGTTRTAKVKPATGRETKAGMTDVQREIHVKQALTRFVRNRDLPQDLEDLRYNLIVARVMSGMLAVEAAEKFGYSNSTQLSLIESGERPVPKDHKFIRQAAQVYAVSVDWLLGLSPHMEPDAKVAHSYALLRGTEGIVNSVIAQITTALVQTASETQPVAEEIERVIAAVDNIATRFEKFCAHEAFQDMPGGAPVVLAVNTLKASTIPLRAKLKKLKSIDVYMTEVRAGSLPAIPYLTERYTRYAQSELGLHHD